MRHCVFRADLQIYAEGRGKGIQYLLFPEILMISAPSPPMLIILCDLSDIVGDLSFHKVARIVAHCIFHKDFSGEW